MKIEKAVFPVGGLGTRFLPATKAIPKEMLPVVDKPLIQYAVDEAYAAGIREMIFITGRHKRAIGDHYDAAFELEHELERGNKADLLKLVHDIKPDDMDCVFIRQPRPLGLGHAVLCAERVVGNDPFAVLLADDLMVGQAGGPSVLQQMVAAYEKSPGTVLAVQDVPREDTRRYGVVDVHGVNDALAEVFGMVEKPVPEVAPSTLAVAGRYILTPAVFESIRRQPRGAGGEIQLTDGIAALIGTEKVYAYRYEGQRYDCGSKVGFLEATIDLALADPSLREAVRAHMVKALG
ncbi:MAG TPA: UTP--glucose-1-phosphate uridylyltransferase [Hydrogenophaga sp.]|jgi:UTP--glucose-1-phosphate uridylyltransferase|uniref:UTP--glucose-1-phosphate uridylyltransferase GalU n=1 Tax=Hydrogenophaga sp. TaxID=1904254 RepID=UPI0008D32D25|nr:UTP--glucose-1-phosphate uridylyltransferase GalU [Hydrogenophaga sp.]MBU4184192.1 UTP--glucose-1-phosphate uridylyltransferase GalU [Gammaproteobacteria bacterium]OGA77452.1 MAG: UTP--glucose-1-phosphate uridylyltransferase [Burkholderiales bacterium GWE1_65_30]OGA93879.1 MAG: UTP--glucose-1-phosphate uridylyltransferase [Burkholderiales bacterium GWF1_66_17]OGB32358.1 MAG: UTP--glucose-1-phosphate uridylyltransferase [Burkholderiales bacterium RIFCSPLOWO2_02_FULL_66_35]PKO78159.1 MAG: UTP